MMHITKKRDLLVFLMALGFINMMLLFMEIALIGGAAFDGFISDGHYYVSNGRRATEVPPILFRLNQLHTITVVITTPVAVIATRQFNKIKKEAANYPFPPTNV